jgi:threonine dehydratase
MADGLACRVPDPAALEIMLAGASRFVTVDDAEIQAAMRHLFSDTHSAAEGAGAAALAALLKERSGRRCAVILSGANVDSEVFARVLSA